jgi:hypothetical protein
MCRQPQAPHGPREMDVHSQLLWTMMMPATVDRGVPGAALRWWQCSHSAAAVRLAAVSMPSLCPADDRCWLQALPQSCGLWTHRWAFGRWGAGTETQPSDLGSRAWRWNSKSVEFESESISRLQQFVTGWIALSKSFGGRSVP